MIIYKNQLKKLNRNNHFIQKNLQKCKKKIKNYNNKMNKQLKIQIKNIKET